MVGRNVRKDILEAFFLEYMISELVQDVRSRYEFRQISSGNIDKLDDSESDIVKKINVLFELSDEEILWKLSSGTPPALIGRVGEMCAYLNETNRTGEKWESRVVEQLSLLGPTEVEKLAQKMAQVEMQRKKGDSLAGNLSNGVRSNLRKRSEKERELAENLRDDLFVIVKHYKQVHGEGQIGSAANSGDTGRVLELLIQTSCRCGANSPRETTQSHSDKARYEQSDYER